MILADLKAIGQVLADIEAIEAGPVSIAVSGSATITVTAANGKQILRTVLAINEAR